jgi:hypothetical protein
MRRFLKKQTLKRMPSSGMFRRVALVRTDVLEERVTSIIRATRIGEIGKTLAVTTTESRYERTASCHPDDGSDTLLRLVGSYIAKRRQNP